MLVKSPMDAWAAPTTMRVVATAHASAIPLWTRHLLAARACTQQLRPFTSPGVSLGFGMVPPSANLRPTAAQREELTTIEQKRERRTSYWQHRLPTPLCEINLCIAKILQKFVMLLTFSKVFLSH